MEQRWPEDRTSRRSGKTRTVLTFAAHQLLMVLVKQGELALPSPPIRSAGGESSKTGSFRLAGITERLPVCVKARTGRLLRERQTGRRCLEASGVFFWRWPRPDFVSFGAENKNTWRARLAATAHHLFVIACAAVPVYILQSVSTGVFIRKSVPSAPPPDLDSEINKAGRAVALDK